MRPDRTLALLSVLSLLLASPVLADDAEARRLLQEAEARHRSKSQEYAGELTVVSRDGKARRKAWRSWREGYAGDARLLIRFSDPPEVRGVGFLSLGRSGKSADQWLYLPSMKRERRIAPQDRDASFVGTDFSYEDLEEVDHAKFEVSLAGEEMVDGHACTLIEGRPKERSAYQRKVFALRKDILYVVRVEAFRKGQKEPAKRLLLTDLAEVGGHTAARTMRMSDLGKGSVTTVLLKELAFDRPQPADRFTLQSLNREE
jgi:hypothetical protein